MYFKPRAKPVLPRYADTIEDVAGYVHDDGTIQPDIETMKFLFNDTAQYGPAFLVRFLDKKSAIFAFHRTGEFKGERSKHEFVLSKYETIKWHDLPDNVKQFLRQHNTPTDLDLTEQAQP